MKKSILDIYDYYIIFHYFYLKPLLVFFGIYPYLDFFMNFFFLKFFLILNTTLINMDYILIYIINSCIPSFLLKTLSLASIVFSLKFIILISFFIFARGGIPRYRYDFLTKVG